MEILEIVAASLHLAAGVVSAVAAALRLRTATRRSHDAAGDL
jgi:hypothetical protein